MKLGRMSSVGHAVGVGGGMIYVYGVSMGTPDGRGLLGRPKPGWEDDIKTDLQEVGWSDMWT